MNENKLINRLSKYIDSDYLFLTPSGTDAIIKSLRILTLPSDAEVIVPSFCCRAVADAVIKCRLKPVFSDVSINNYNISVADIEKVLTQKTAAVIVVHLFGQPATIDEIIDYAKRKSIFVIEDAAQAFGGVYKNGAKLGTLGDIGIFSFGYEKIIDAGGGGAILTNRNDFAVEFKKQVTGYKNHKQWTERLDFLMNSIDDNLSIRRENAILYKKHLNINLITHPEYLNGLGTFFRYSCALNYDCRSKLIEELKRDGELATTLYSQPLHAIYGNPDGNFKNTDSIASRIINMFVRSPYTGEYIIKITDKIKKTLESINE
ncbi:MAG: DegT/DnrJ/EryC1/StrS family aminotransferase [Nitrospinae bacterium]|nr:DegT/DnrJ/EryC1/StrS family aminotransferase [Nitrospinota bacterium]